MLRLHQDIDLLHAYIKSKFGFGDLRAIPLKNLTPLNHPQSPLRSSLKTLLPLSQMSHHLPKRTTRSSFNLSMRVPTYHFAWCCAPLCFFGVMHSLSYSAAKDLLALLQLLISGTNTLLPSLYLFQKFFSQFRSKKMSTMFH